MTSVNFGIVVFTSVNADYATAHVDSSALSRALETGWPITMGAKVDVLGLVTIPITLAFSSMGGRYEWRSQSIDFVEQPTIKVDIVAHQDSGNLSLNFYE